MNVLDMTIIRLAAGLVLLIAANIALGSINAIIDGEWDQTKFRNGCIKSAVVAAALVAVYFAGYLNPDLMVSCGSGRSPAYRLSPQRGFHRWPRRSDCKSRRQ